MTHEPGLIGQADNDPPQTSPLELLKAVKRLIEAWPVWQRDTVRYTGELAKFSIVMLLNSVVIALAGNIVTSNVADKMGPTIFQYLSIFRVMEWYLSALAYGFIVTNTHINLRSAEIEKDEKIHREINPNYRDKKQWADIGKLFWHGFLRATLYGIIASIALCTLLPRVIAYYYSDEASETLKPYLYNYTPGVMAYFWGNAFNTFLFSKEHGPAVIVIELIACTIGYHVGNAAMMSLEGEPAPTQLGRNAWGMVAQYWIGFLLALAYTYFRADKDGLYAIFKRPAFDAYEFFSKLGRSLSAQGFIALEMTTLVMNQQTSNLLGSAATFALGVTSETDGGIVLLSYTFADACAIVINRHFKNGDVINVPKIARTILLAGLLFNSLISCVFLFPFVSDSLFKTFYVHSEDNDHLYIEKLRALTTTTIQAVALTQAPDYLRLAFAGLLRGLDQFFVSSVVALLCLGIGIAVGVLAARSTTDGLTPPFDFEVSRDGLNILLLTRFLSLTVSVLCLGIWTYIQFRSSNLEKLNNPVIEPAQASFVSRVSERLGSIGLFKNYALFQNNNGESTLLLPKYKPEPRDLTEMSDIVRDTLETHRSSSCSIQ